MIAMIEKYGHFLMTVDPVHIGTGGYRLGRVDNSIIREPGTNLPKIPGTALHGAIRHYAAYRYGKPKCAGQSGHCGRPTCPVCYTFGSVAGDRARAGVVRIHDARILLFPVYSMVGPVWITSPSALYDAGFSQNGQPFTVGGDKARWSDNLVSKDHLNLSWLMVEREENLPDIGWPEQLPTEIRNRVVLVSDKLFSQIVNSNLEVRTSVSINPETGAAEERALFTYEAIPRATVLWMDVVVDDYAGEFPSKEKLERWGQTLQNEGKDDEKKKLLMKWNLIKKNETSQEDETQKALEKALEWLKNEKTHENNGEIWRWEKSEMQGIEQTPKGIIRAGLDWLEYLGVGGMGTRGFGRVKLICYKKEEPTKANSTLKEC